MKMCAAHRISLFTFEYEEKRERKHDPEKQSERVIALSAGARCQRRNERWEPLNFTSSLNTFDFPIACVACSI